MSISDPAAAQEPAELAGAPEQRPLPTRIQGTVTRRLGEIDWQTPAIFIHERPLEALLDYSQRFPTREVGGFLLGGWHVDEQQYIEIREFLPAEETRSGPVSLTFTHETWAQLHRQVARDFPTERIVGWQHTHPGLGVFLSEHDLFIQRHFFSAAWQVALVVDPQQQQLSFFQWKSGRIEDSGFFCVLPATH